MGIFQNEMEVGVHKQNADVIIELNCAVSDNLVKGDIVVYIDFFLPILLF